MALAILTCHRLLRDRVIARRVGAGLGQPGSTTECRVERHVEGLTVCGQVLGRLGELANSPLVVCTLVPDPGQQGASGGGVAVDLELLTLSVRPQIR